MVRPRLAFSALVPALLIAQSALAGINFVGAELTSVPPQADFMATGDFNNDGLADVVVVSPASKNISTFLASPASPSRFAPARAVPVGDTLRGMAIGDLNRDGRLDVAVADQAADGVWILLGKGDGTFLDPYIIPVPNTRNPYGVAIADFDQTGAPDLAVIDRRENKVFILLNDNGSPPRFRRGGDFVVGLEPEQILALDLNKDGQPDIVTLDLGGPRVKDVSVTLFKRVQQGFPEFAEPVQFVVGENPSDMVAGDFNNDGTPDIAMLNRPTNTGRVSEVDVLMATGTGELLPPPGIPVPCPFFTNGQPCKGLALAVGDYDGNGNIDLAVALTDPRSRGSNQVQLVDAMQLFGGRGDGAFVPGPVFGIQKAPQSMASGDVTGDGKPDIMVGAQRSLSLQAFINVGSPGGLQNGDPCLTGDECLSARCTNGVCCGAACEPSELCNIPGREGICVPQSDGVITDCQDPSDCPATQVFCVDNVCCDTACDGGTCQQPGFEGVCVPLLVDGADCSEDAKCSSGFCSSDHCCKERCDGGFCDEFGICSPLAELGSDCMQDAQCQSNVCDAFDEICCNRKCLTNDEFCNPDGVCTGFGEPGTPTPTQLSSTPGVTTTPVGPTATPTLRSTPAPTGELCSVPGDCQSNNCVNDVCCAVSECGANEHCAEGSGQCEAGGTPTSTFTPTRLPTQSPGPNPCQPNPCSGGQKCVVGTDGGPVCIAASSSSGCSTTDSGGSGNLLVVASMPFLLWVGRRWQLKRATVRANRTRR